MTRGPDQPLRIGIIGCQGRVGRLLVEEVRSDENLTLAGGTVRPGTEPPDGLFTTDDAEKLLAVADIVIDFTRPEVTAKTVRLAARHRVPYVTGTTGLNAAQLAELNDAAREIPILHAANMSVGVTVLAALVEQAARRLGPDWDIEILETHHKHKIDSPSGTALLLGRAAGDQVETHDLNRTGKRPPGAIGYAVQRGGDVVGEHTVSFFGTGERIELSHRATDRRLFARGALRAALWLKNQPPGLYSMRDVLGL